MYCAYTVLHIHPKKQYCVRIHGYGRVHASPGVAVPAGPDGRGAQRAQTWFTEQNVTEAAENERDFAFSVVVPTAELQLERPNMWESPSR